MRGCAGLRRAGAALWVAGVLGAGGVLSAAASEAKAPAGAGRPADAVAASTVLAYGGSRLRVRQGDGIRRSSAGASIAASLVVRRMRADRPL